MKEKSPNWRALKKSLQETDDFYVLALSGGVDSMFLLDFLIRNNINFVAVHFNHRLHDKANEVALFLREQRLEKYNKAFSLFTITRMEPFEGNVESAARDWRYSEIQNAWPDTTVLTAHHLNDQVETVLMRLMRGKPHDDLAMQVKQGNRFRPLLDISKTQIIQEARRRNVDWMEDPTNDDITMERNWVRHVLLPQMMERRNVMRTIPNGIINASDN